MTPQYITINEFGDKYYYNDKEMTKLHRTDGPAFEGSDGSKEWRIDGKLHRADGPAVEWSDGRQAWYLNHKKLSYQEFIRLTAPEIVLTIDEIAAKLGIEVSKLKIKK